MTEQTTAKSGIVLGLVVAGWLLGTLGFFVAATPDPLCFSDCHQYTPGERIHYAHLLQLSIACASVLPLLGLLICIMTFRSGCLPWFLTVALLLGVAYGLTAGPSTVRTIHRAQLTGPAPLPSDYCPCYSGGRCDCPGG
jgi:hypothetical protein